jgi:hypothetical protein
MTLKGAIAANGERKVETYRKKIWEGDEKET